MNDCPFQKEAELVHKTDLWENLPDHSCSFMYPENSQIIPKSLKWKYIPSDTKDGKSSSGLKEFGVFVSHPGYVCGCAHFS